MSGSLFHQKSDPWQEFIKLARNDEWETLIQQLTAVVVVVPSDDTIEEQPFKNNFDIAQLWESILSSNDSKSSENCHVIINLIHTMIQRWGTEVVAVTTPSTSIGGQTPVHYATLQSCHPQVIQALAIAAPGCAYYLDCDRRRPIDYLSHKIVMMEERVKYNHRHRSNSNNNNNKTTQQEQEVDECMNNLWDCVRILAIAMAPSTREPISPGGVVEASARDDQDHQLSSSFVSSQQLQQESPIFHACLLVQDFPTALMERVFRRYATQLELPDAYGNLPLHIIAAGRTRRELQSQHHDRDDDQANLDNDDEHLSSSTPPKGIKCATKKFTVADDEDNERDNQNKNNNDDDDLELLTTVLSRYPDAAQRRNHLGQSPLDVAVDHGQRRWRTGIRVLLQAFPEAMICRDDILLEHYPMILSRFMNDTGGDDDDDRVIGLGLRFSLLRATPALFLQAHK